MRWQCPQFLLTKELCCDLWQPEFPAQTHPEGAAPDLSGSAPWNPEPRPGPGDPGPASKIALLRAQKRLWPAPILPTIRGADGRGIHISNSHRPDDLNFPLGSDLIQHDRKVWLLWGKLFPLGANVCVHAKVRHDSAIRGKQNTP